jgi:uncharacterized protein YutE (UPF0331/DUF86 family)
MLNRIKDKIEEIEKDLEEIAEIIPEEFEEYNRDFKTKAACERYFERIINSTIDLSFLIIKENNFMIPEEEKQSFDILHEKNIISEKLRDKLKEAKGMRNILSHEYGKINDEIVFESIREELIKDIEEFIDSIEKFLK